MTASLLTIGSIHADAYHHLHASQAEIQAYSVIVVVKVVDCSNTETYEESIGMQPDVPAPARSRSITSRIVEGASKANHCSISLACN